MNQEIYTYHFVTVDHKGMAVHLTRSDCEGSKTVDGNDDAMLWNDSEKDGNVRSESEEDDGTGCDDGLD
jgi:hypothetical protein